MRATRYVRVGLSPRVRRMPLRAGVCARDVSVHFDGLKAVDQVDLELGAGEIVGLIGPNGAGKTTLINALTGFQPLTSGRITFDDQDVTGWSPDRLARAGMVRTFQSVRSFGKLSVIENVELGGLAGGLRRHDARASAWKLLAFLGLSDRAAQPAASLPQGEERKLGILRALASRPAVLLLDEPAAGLSEAESNELTAAIGEIRRRWGCGVVVIEHDMRVIMNVCDRVTVLNYGRKLATGTPKQIQQDPAVVEAYLGPGGGLSLA